MPRLAEVVLIEGRYTDLLQQAADRARERAREREDRWQRLQSRRLIERLMRQRKAAGE